MKFTGWYICFIIGLQLAFSACSRTERVHYIAHGGGWIEGIPCPNCVEAVEWSLDNGVKYIELDLRLTSDSQIVAMHDWKFFHALTDEACLLDSNVLAIMHDGVKFDSLYRSDWVDSSPLPLADVLQRKIAGKFTPITWIWIDSLMRFNDTVCLVTDKMSDPDLINPLLFPYRDRVMVECFSWHDYQELTGVGYTCMLSDFNFPDRQMLSWFDGLRLWRRMRNNNQIMPISFVCRKRPSIEKGWFADLKRRYSYNRLFGRWFAVYSVNNCRDADSIAQYDPRVKYVYVNNVEVKNGKN